MTWYLRIIFYKLTMYVVVISLADWMLTEWGWVAREKKRERWERGMVQYHAILCEWRRMEGFFLRWGTNKGYASNLYILLVKTIPCLVQQCRVAKPKLKRFLGRREKFRGFSFSNNCNKHTDTDTAVEPACPHEPWQPRPPILVE